MFKGPGPFPNPEIYYRTQPKFEDRSLIEGNRLEVTQVAQRVEGIIDRSRIDRIQRLPVPPIPEPIPDIVIEGIDLKKFIEALLKTIKDIDWENVKKELGGSLNSLVVSLIAIGNKELVNIPLPNLEALRKLLDKYKDKLPKDQLEKINEQINNLIKKLKEKNKQGSSQEITPDEWLRREKEKNNQVDEARRNPTKGFMTSEERDARNLREEDENRSLLDKLIAEISRIENKRAREMANNLVRSISELSNPSESAETRKRIAKIIALIGAILAMSGLLTGSSSRGEQVGTNTIYPDIYGNQPDIELENDSSTGNRVVEQRPSRQTPDANITDQINILEGINIQGSQDALELFGVSLGSIADRRGEGVISIENKTDDRSVATIMAEKNREVVWLAVTNVNGERVILNLERGASVDENGVPILDLNKLSEGELTALANGTLTWNTVEVKNGVRLSSASQNGAVNLQAEAQKLLSNKIMNRVLGARGENLR